MPTWSLADILVESDPSSETAERYGMLARVARAQDLVFTEQDGGRDPGDGAAGSLAIQLDVTERERVDAVVAQVLEQFGQIDILVNNAATLDHLGPIPDRQIRRSSGSATSRSTSPAPSTARRPPGRT